MFRFHKVAFTALTLFVLFSGMASAVPPSTVVLTFDEETPGLKFGSPIRGVTIAGVTFDFTRRNLASIDAFYGGVIHLTPGEPDRVLVHVQEPALEGNAQGVLTMVFTTETPRLSFGVARSVSSASVTIRLFEGSGQLISTTRLPLTPSGDVSEGLFDYNGGPAVKKAAVSFPNAATDTRFALDNLTFIVP